ncbi:MAG: tetratricopeptide repeat protein, partial [Cyclobacteriaceae bacterium]
SEMEPEDSQVWLNWSYLYFEQGDVDYALEVLEDGINENPENANLYYRSVVYLIEKGRYKEAINRLETALMLNYEGHTVLYDFFPKLHTQKALFKIINQYKKNNS